MNSVDTKIQGFEDSLFDIKDTVEETKKKLIEKILEATSASVQAASSSEEILSIVSKAQDVIVAQVGNDPSYAPAIQQLNELISNNNEINSSVVSTRSISKRMATTLSSSAEIRQSVTGASAVASRSTVNSSSPATAYPSPPLPDSGAPDFDTLEEFLARYTDNITYTNLTEEQKIKDALNRLLEGINKDGAWSPAPDAMNKLMKALSLLSKEGKLSPDVQHCLTQYFNLVGNGTDGGIAVWIRQMADYAFAGGYKNLTGDAARTAWVNDQKALWESIPYNKYQADILQCLGLDSVVKDPNLKQDAQGNIIYTRDGVIYNWDDTDTGENIFSDRQIIMNIFNGQSVSADGKQKTNPFFNGMDLLGMERDFRVSTLNQLLKTFKDPMFAIVFFFMQSKDGELQAQQAGNTKATDDNTEWQKYSQTLSKEVQKFQNGTATPADAKNFIRALYGAKVFVDEHPNMEQIAASFKTDVFDAITSLHIVPGDAKSQTIGDLISSSGSDYKNIADKLNQAFKTLPDPSQPLDPKNPPNYTPNPNSTAAVQAVNTFTSQTTGIGKQNETAAAYIASVNAALLKMGDSALKLQKINDTAVGHYNDK